MKNYDGYAYKIYNTYVYKYTESSAACSNNDLRVSMRKQFHEPLVDMC